MTSFRKRDSMGLYDEYEPIPLPRRFAEIKTKLVAGHEENITRSWQRLIQSLRKEINDIAAEGAACVPTINFKQRHDRPVAAEFAMDLRKRGVAIIRGVLDEQEALAFAYESQEYLAANPQTKGWPPEDPQLLELCWNPAQVKARAHPDVLEAQKFAMSIWHSTDPSVPVSPEIPVTYADRLQVRSSAPSLSASASASAASSDAGLPSQAHVNDGSVERWEPEGYGRSGTYDDIFAGEWEAHDPWDYAARHKATTDLYHGAGSCSMFRMFQGWLCLSADDSNASAPLLDVCPALRQTTAYFLLRPLFEPRGGGSWTLSSPQDSILHGALPSYTQELSPATHPHLELHRSLVPAPALRPGDWLIWHPDAVHAYPERGFLRRDVDGRCSSSTTLLHLPACPLTQSNALFLARQRRAFLLGLPGPDFESGRGERDHAGRPGVSEVNESGGEEALRAMGLLPFEESDAKTEGGKRAVQVANAILFPDRFDMI